jgi:hypothetical protein
MEFVLIVLLVVAVALYLFDRYIPFPAKIGWVKRVIEATVVLLTLLWLLDGFGVFGPPHWHQYHWRR